MKRDNFEKEMKFAKKLKPGEEREKEYDLLDVKEGDIRVRTIDMKWENEISYEYSQYKKGYTMDKLFF